MGNVVLVARSHGCMKKVQEGCESYGVKCMVIMADVSIDGHMDDITSALRALPGDVSVIVNNVGGRPPTSLPSVPNPSLAEEIDTTTHSSYFKFNVLPAAHLVHSLLEGMVHRNKGYILNVAS